METSQATGNEGSSQSKEDVIDVDNEGSKEPMADEQNIDDKKKGGKRSWVWDHFTLVNDGKSVKCPYCKTVLAGNSKKNGTSSMSNHLYNVCTLSPVFKKVAQKKQSTLNFKPVVKGEKGAGSLTTHSFSQERCRKLLAKMCIKDNRPFSVVDDEGFRDFVWELNPSFKMPSRWTVARDCLSIYKDETNNLKGLLKGQTVSLTTDTWTSVQNFNYMCLTAHWVDDSWILRKKILNFCQISNHRGLKIGKLVYKCLQKWNIQRVFTVTVDNASSNDTAIKFLTTMLKGPHAILDCKYLHLRCCAHIINLVVRDGLDEHFDSISRIRNAVRYVRSSPSRFESFLDAVLKLNISCKRKPCLDCETRWNSIFLMLETAEKYVDAFERLSVVHENYRSYFRGANVEDGEGCTRKRKRNERVLGAPGAEDWENARGFIEYLKIFFNVTKKVSGSQYVTANLFFGELVTMQATIARMCNNVDEKKKKMAESMKEKYDKYWDNIDNINFLLHIALVLDPRNKLCYLEYCLGLIHGNNSTKCNDVLDRVRKALDELYNHYKMKIETSNAKHTNVSSSSGVFESDLLVDFEDDYAKFMEERGQGANKTEVDIYLSDGMEKRKKNDTFNVLGWWKGNSVKFPILSLVARHVLAMPISTVASESAFSTGGRVIDQFRSSLTPNTAEALICTQDWIRNTPADLHDTLINGEELQTLVENLEKLEVDEFPMKEQQHVRVADED